MAELTASMVSTAPTIDPRWDDLVDRLQIHDVCYLTGGSAWDGRQSPYCKPADAAIDALVLDLARAPQARLRHALVALLFRHPEHASAALAVAQRLPAQDRARLLLRVSVLVAAALRRMWRFVLGIYLPGQPAIDAAELAHAIGVPSPDEDYGRPCLAALADLLREGQPFPFAYERAWRDVAGHVLAELRAEAG